MEIKIIVLAPHLNTEVGVKSKGDLVQVSESWYHKRKHSLKRAMILADEDHIKTLFSATNDVLRSWCNRRNLPNGGSRRELLARLLEGLAEVPAALPKQVGRGAKEDTKEVKKPRRKRSKKPQVEGEE